ncbi:MAG: hypothetical protein AB8B85_12535 [Paracoccaceae bacterium]
MSDQNKKVDVRFGAFACTIEGYDNPVERLQEVLGLMQKMISDTPALARGGEGFDSKQLQQALDGDGSPGIVVIRNEAPDITPDTSGAEDATHADGTAAPEPEVEVAAETAEAKLDGSAFGQGLAAAATAGAAYASSQAVADTADSQDPGLDSANNRDLDTANTTAVEPEDAATSAVEESHQPVDSTPEAPLTDIFAEAETAKLPEAEFGNPAQAYAQTEAPAQELHAHELDPDGASVPLTAVEPDLDELASPETAVAAASSAMADAFDSNLEATEAKLDAELETAHSTDSQSLPTPEPDTDFASEPPAFTELAADVEPEPAPEQIAAGVTETAEPVTVSNAPDPTPDSALSSSPLTNIFAAPAAAALAATATSALPPDADPVHGEGSDNQLSDTIDEMQSESRIEGGPTVEHVSKEADAPVVEISESEPAPLASIFAPPPNAEKVRDLGAVASEAVLEPASGGDGDPSDDVPFRSIFASPQATGSEPVAKVPPQPDVESVEDVVDDVPFRSIFAAPPAADPEPEPPSERQPEEIAARAEPTVEPEEPATSDKPSRFQQLLSRVHGATTMSAPGETEATQPPEQAPAAGPLTSDNETTQIAAAELAQMAQADTVADELAVSAAWLTLVKGQARFTRREVMSVLETIPADQPRELADRIKGFGKLVRSGSLVLIDDGIFAMAQGDRERFRGLLT